MQLDGKTAVVTGTALGLGRAYALRLARLGADVAVVEINLDSAAEFGETLSAPTVSDEISNRLVSKPISADARRCMTSLAVLSPRSAGSTCW